MDFQPLNFKDVQTGSILSGSSGEVQWTFSLNGVYHLVELRYVYYTGWKQVRHNGRVIYDGGG